MSFPRVVSLSYELVILTERVVSHCVLCDSIVIGIALFGAVYSVTVTGFTL